MCVSKDYGERIECGNTVLSSVSAEMRDKLRKWREDNNRNSEQIVDVGEELISEHASKLGDDSKFVQLLLFAKLKTLLQHPYICCN